MTNWNTEAPTTTIDITGGRMSEFIKLHVQQEYYSGIKPFCIRPEAIIGFTSCRRHIKVSERLIDGYYQNRKEINGTKLLIASKDEWGVTAIKEQWVVENRGMVAKRLGLDTPKPSIEEIMRKMMTPRNWGNPSQPGMDGDK